MDRELIAYFDEHFGSLRGEIASLREETSGRLERLEVSVRQGRVEVEGLRGEIRLLAEGIASVEEKMASFQRRVTGEIAEVRDLIRPAYSALDDRLKLLESWRERKDRDPIDVIRERFGLGKSPFSSA